MIVRTVKNHITKGVVAFAAATILLTSGLAVADTRVTSSSSFDRSSSCSSIWHHASHRWKYSRLIPNVYVKVRMWVTTKTYHGSAKDRLSCWERWYFSDRMTNVGEVYADAPQNGWPLLRLLKMSNSAHNQALYETYKSASAYGTSAQTPRCGFSSHTVVIKGRTYRHTRHSGYCAQNIPD